MTVRDFINVFSHGSVVFRLSTNGDFPIICRSDADKGNFDGIEPLYYFELLDSRIIDIIHTPSEVHVFIIE